MLLIAATVAAVAGCSLKMARIERPLLAYERALTLEIVAIDSSPVSGPAIRLQVTLKNISATERESRSIRTAGLSITLGVSVVSS